MKFGFPIDAAAIICTAQPQSIDDTEVMEPIVFASAHHVDLICNGKEIEGDLHPTTHARKFRHFGEDKA